MLRLAYALFVVALLLALATPLALGRPGPDLLGLPFPLWWNAAWVIGAFLATGTFHVLSGGEDPE